MRLSVILSDPDAAATDPLAALARERALLADLHGRVDGIVLTQAWGTGSFSLQALTYGAFLAAEAGALRLTIRDIPLDVVNPVEVAEQILTVDHAWQGRLDVRVAMGPAAVRDWFGITGDPEARFEESLHLIRRMWAVEPFQGEGPVFVFDPVRPTLRPARPGGPPVGFEASDAAGASLAGRLGLGLHLPVGLTPAGRAELVDAYRGAGGDGALSIDLVRADAADDTLAALEAEGFVQADVHLHEAGDDAAAPAAFVAGLRRLPT